MEPTTDLLNPSLLECLVQERKYAKAIKIVKNHIAASPVRNDWQLYVVLGSIYAFSGDKAAALEAFNEALTLVQKATFPTQFSDPELASLLGLQLLNKDAIIEEIRSAIIDLENGKLDRGESGTFGHVW